ncbi:hypothetical protein EBV26_21250 [bacterium]|nr:hypothetical protein [bacterium]
MSNKRIFSKIYRSIPKEFFADEDGVFGCAISIYLTWCGIRPACIPFDGDYNDKKSISSNEMFDKMMTAKGKKCLETLSTIQSLKVVVGPYYDSGTAIVVYNVKLASMVEPLLHSIERFRQQMERMPDRALELQDKIHYPLGKVLGYPCPVNLRKVINKKSYHIGFPIRNRTLLGSSCPITPKSLALSSILLEKMKKALAEITNDPITLKISIENAM